MLRMPVIGTSGQEVHDLENLPLNGKLAHTLDQGALFRALKPLDIASINPCMAKTDLLVAYARHRKANDADQKERDAVSQKLAAQRAKEERAA